ncbi:DNA-binding protein [Burkholderia cenocepacia]|uniref:DNA-binding protein n=1 Tax=Burkholderia cenocepacia TaxID=95486 RepID=UPI00076DCB1B|nr:DNA-binding protein [Burkholderia cenocepacia]KWU17888.1 hypothetical protein AS149_14525 [Burkholderia cenocepacia]
MKNTVVALDKKRSGAVAVTSPDSDSAEYLEYLRTRKAWSGVFHPDELDKPGGRLISALMACADERNEQRQNMARELGVTYGYVNQLRNGTRDVANIADSFAQACADYLGVPRLLVLALAGRVTVADAYAERNVLEAEIPRAIEFIRRDPKWAALVPQSIVQRGFEEQFLIIKLYEKAEGRTLLPESLDLKQLFQAMEALDVERRERAARVLERAESSDQEV